MSTHKSVSCITVQEQELKPVKKLPINVIEEIERGNVINQQRICKKDVKNKYKILPLYENKSPAQAKKSKKKRKAKQGGFSFYKIVYPKSPGKSKGRNCNHYDNTIIDRQILDKAEHIKLLATPKMGPQRKFPRFVKVEIPPCTNRLNEMAQPKKANLILTWKQKLPTITAPEIENYHRMLNKYAFTSTNDVMKYIKQQRKDEKFRRAYEKRRILQLKKMAQKCKIRDTKEVMEHLFNNVKPFLLKDQRFALMDELAERSKYITKLLCDFTGIPSPCRMSPNIFDKFILNLSDKFAVWMSHLINAANYDMFAEAEEDKAQEAPSLEGEEEAEDFMYPIEDYIQWIPDDEAAGTPTRKSVTIDDSVK